MPDYLNGEDRILIIRDGLVDAIVEGSVSEDGNVLSMFIYDGADTSVSPKMTIVIDTDPDPIALPEGAVELDMNQFMMKLEEYFQ